MKIDIGLTYRKESNISTDKYNASFINALSEERDPKILFDFIVKLHKENIDLKESNRNLSRELTNAYSKW